jgi:hypothetical protein
MGLDVGDGDGGAPESVFVPGMKKQGRRARPRRRRGRSASGAGAVLVARADPGDESSYLTAKGSVPFALDDLVLAVPESGDAA